MGSPARTTFFDWLKKHKGNLSRDTLDRLRDVLDVYEASHLLFSDRSVAASLHNPNSDSLFNGKSPRDYVVSGFLVALADVRR